MLIDKSEQEGEEGCVVPGPHGAVTIVAVFWGSHVGIFTCHVKVSIKNFNLLEE